MAQEMLWKTMQLKIKGQSKPFIDANLQMQVPDLDVLVNPRSVYQHYCQNTKILSPEMEMVESELYLAIMEAQQTHAAWKKMQSRLLEAVTK